MIYVRDETDYAILRRAEDMLDTEFNWQIASDEFKGWVNENEFDIIDGLCTKIDELQEKIEDMEEDIRQNYRHISMHEFYGVNEKDF